MGSRILVQCYSKNDGYFGPILYCHDRLYDAREIVLKLKKQMKSRFGDVEYSSARLVQVACNDTSDSGFGIWNANAILNEIDCNEKGLDIVLINVDNFTCTCFGGYHQIDEHGLPFRLNS